MIYFPKSRGSFESSHENPYNLMSKSVTKLDAGPKQSILRNLRVHDRSRKAAVSTVDLFQPRAVSTILHRRGSACSAREMSASKGVRPDSRSVSSFEITRQSKDFSAEKVNPYALNNSISTANMTVKEYVKQVSNKRKLNKSALNYHPTSRDKNQKLNMLWKNMPTKSCYLDDICKAEKAKIGPNKYTAHKDWASVSNNISIHGQSRKGKKYFHDRITLCDEIVKEARRKSVPDPAAYKVKFVEPRIILGVSD